MFIARTNDIGANVTFELVSFGQVIFGLVEIVESSLVSFNMQYAAGKEINVRQLLLESKIT